MKKIYLFLFILLFASTAYAAEITSTGSGNFSDSATWVGGSAPSASDTFVIASGHTVTVAANATSAGGTIQSITDGGLILSAKLTMTGNLIVGNGASKDGGVVFGAGSELALSSADVVLNNCKLRSTSTSSEWAKVTGTGNISRGSVYSYPKQDISLRYVSFLNVGNLVFSASSTSSGHASLTNQIDCSNMVIVGAGNIELGHGGVTPGSTNVKFNSSDIRDYTGSLILTGQDATTGAREFHNNTLSISSGISVRGIQAKASGYSLNGSVFDRVKLKGAASGTSTDPLIQTDIFLGSGIAADDFTNGFGYLAYSGSTVDGSYVYIPVNASNPHVGDMPSNGAITNNVFEVYGSEPNVIMRTTTALNTQVDIIGNVAIGNGAFVSQVGNNAGNGTINVLHNTVYTSSGATGLHRGLWLSENGNFAGTLNVKSNIHAIASGISCDYSLWDNDATPQPVNSDYNTFRGLSVSPYYGLTVTGATSDNTLDPQFVDATRNLTSWGSEIGVAETYSAVVGQLLLRNGYSDATKAQSATPSGVTPTQLVNWVRAGFAPTNSALEDAGHDGVTIGAVEIGTVPDPDPDPDPDPEDPGKFVSVTLYSNTTPLANMTGLTAIWWDVVPPLGNPAYSTASASTNANGTLILNLSDYTSLNATENGFLFVYQHNATDYRKSRLFGTQTPIWEQ